MKSHLLSFPSQFHRLSELWETIAENSRLGEVAKMQDETRYSLQAERVRGNLKVLRRRREARSSAARIIQRFLGELYNVLKSERLS